MRSRHPRDSFAFISVPLLLVVAVLQPALSDELVNVTCGARGQRPCLLLPYPDNGWLRGGLRADGCDRGLTSTPDICYWDTWFGEVPYPCLRCRNLTRESLVVEAFADSFEVQALAEQRRLAQDEPINWFTQVGSHNAFNALDDGYVINPNQRHSLTDQLKLGSRVLFLDIHELFTGVKLSHGVAEWWQGPSPTDRHIVMALREIREWVQANPDEIVMLSFEDYWGDDDSGRHEFVQGLRNQLGPWLLRISEKPSDRWPTRSEMLARGRQVIAVLGYCGGSHAGTCAPGPSSFGDPPPHGGDVLFDGRWTGGGSTAREFACTEKFLAPGNHFRTVEEESLRWGPLGVIGYDGCDDSRAGAICPGDGTCNKNPWHDELLEPACAAWVNVKDLVACNVSTISLDQVGSLVWTGSPLAIVPASPLAIFADMIWSWEADHRGWREDNKAAALSRSSGRWRARSLAEVHRFACGYLRQETGWYEGPSSDVSGPGTEWRITSMAGTWQEGGKACMDEFGQDGFLLSVPVNSLQNQQLLARMAAANVDQVWLGYRDVDAASGSTHVTWRIDRGLGLATIDARPVPAFEGDQVAFDSKWTAAEITPCQAAADEDAWLFGDSTPGANSPSIVITPNVGAQFTAWHTYSDNGPYMVRHSLPAACGQQSHTRLQVINNVAPRMRIDCESWWSECGSQPVNDVRLPAGQPWTFRAAYHDAGAADAHTATVDWGDGNESAMTVTPDAQSDDGVTGVIEAQHTFMSCETFAVNVDLADDDGGLAIETVAVLVDEAAPVVTCPPTVVVEGTSPVGAPANLGKPSVIGGYCGGIETANDARDVYPYGITEVHWVVRNVHESFDPQTQQPVRHEAGCTQAVKVMNRRCDFNRDGKLDDSDRRGLLESLQGGKYLEAGDLNGDGRYSSQEFATCFWRIPGRTAR